MIKTGGLLLILLVIVTATGFYGKVMAAEKKPIKIGYDLWPGYAALVIAKEKGYFAEEGLNLKIIKYSDYLKGWDDFSNNNLDGHFGVFTDTIVKRSEGFNIKTVYFTDASYGQDVIVAKKEIRTIADLMDKKISVIGINSFSHIWVSALLEKNGLNEVDVQFANIDNSAVPRALASGEIDAGHTYGPFVAEAVKAGFHILDGATTKEVHGIIVDDLAFHSKFIKERSDDISKIIKSLNRAVQFLQTNQLESHAIVSKDFEMDIQDVAAYFKDAKIFNVENNKQLLNKKTPGSIHETFETITSFLLKRGQLPEVLYFKDIIEPKFIQGQKELKK